MHWTATGRPGGPGRCLMSLWTISKIAEPQHWHRRLLTRCLPPPGGGRAAGARGGGEEEGGRSRTLFSFCSLQVAARIRHNKVLFVHLNHTMSPMFLVALLVQRFPEFRTRAHRLLLDVRLKKSLAGQVWRRRGAAGRSPSSWGSESSGTCEGRKWE